ncbi:acyl carrier protein [Streptomyces sp. SL13]|jgi:acyl carrier protein|uniref:Acyl carrier protein n=1 Tax=Streptantibioticus silvisoli TaxID=2705255 RepID=A0AA90H4K4_9ACTN|nr:acyl carrier protein [Streptantibioticus silvisoli]MDI5961383.1 acyl carrier protein [Streptantibioticus silvisoli]MDI5973329.1 acyl carrier protein [Streptantibioticus silvisoli]
MAVEVSADQVRDAVKAYLGRFLDDMDGMEDVDLISGGLLDSLVAVQLIDFIQNRFGVTVDDEDLEIANFDSVNRVVAFVERKRGRA